MNTNKPFAVAAALAILACASASQPAFAAVDSKSISPMECLPRGPGTTAAELTYGPYGITNPGVSNETVICPITGDSESAWSATPGTSAYLYVYYRTGSVSGNIACTAFAGTAVTTASPTYAISYTAPTLAPNTRNNFYLNLADTTGYYGVAPPTSLVCTLSPKAALGWIYVRENLATDTP